jgi:CHAT domain-containing protein/Tfp pilus assembly protein PilF
MGGKSQTRKKQEAHMRRWGEAGWQAIQKADFAAAESAYVKAVKAARDLGDLKAVAVFLNYLGLARRSLANLEQARADLESCIELAASEGLARVEAHARLLLGEQLRESGDADSAIGHLMRALEISLDAGDEIGAEMAFGNLGLIYLERAWYEPALECFRQALQAGAASPNRAAWLGSLGQALAELGQFEEATRYYLEAFAEAGHHKDVRAQAICRGSQGNALFELGHYQEAVVCYGQAVELSSSAGDLVRQSVWLGNMANVYRKEGALAAAVKTCRQALDIARTLADQHAEAAHLDSLGDCLMETGQVDEAMDCYQQALQISQSIVDRQGQRIYLSNLGRAHQRLGQLAPAFDYLSRAIDLFDEQRARIKSDDLKTSFAARGQELYRDMVQVCLAMGRRVEALEYVGRAKSRAILDLLANSPIDVTELGGAEDESLRKLIAREAQLRNQIARLERLFWQGSSGAESGHRGAAAGTEDARAIYNEWRETINQLKRRHPNYASLVAVQTLNFSEIKALWQPSEPAQSAGRASLLDANVAILEYYWTDQYLLAASIWSGCPEPTVHFLSDRKQIDRLASDLADFLEMSATEGWEVPVSLCQRLYEGFMAPILVGLPESVDRLILVPHGTLYHLPFSALFDGQKYLVERYAISYVPATSLIPVLARTRAAGEVASVRPRYLVSAISDYSETRKQGLVFSSRLRSAAGLDDLSYTIEEARTVLDVGSTHAVEARLLTNQEVKDALPALFSQYPVIHFAGHAVFNPEEPLASGLVLADGTILSAASILQGNVLRTHCGQLLVLSACQTGVNMVTPGGEILGLARALMYAGMPNLILSLWEVADRSTADLMQEFHRSWQAGKVPIAEALRRSQQQAVSAGQPVHAWAPFIHLGIE